MENIHYSREVEIESKRLKEWNSENHRRKINYIVKKNDRKKSDKLIWGLVTCLNKCGKSKEMSMNYKHNRDRNACLNMEKIVEHLRVDNTRPSNYRRDNEQSSL